MDRLAAIVADRRQAHCFQEGTYHGSAQETPHQSREPKSFPTVQPFGPATD
jgi:hypothetical protein